MARPKKVQENEIEAVVEIEAVEPVTDEQGIELPTTNEAPKPVTLQGKAVPMSANGKAFLRNTNTGRIITGLIDHKLAEQQAAQFPHIEVVNP